MTGIKLFDYAIEGNDKPLTESAMLTRYAPGKFDYVVSQSSFLKSLWPKVKAANPGLIWAVYTNETHTINKPPYFPADYYLWDAQHRPVTSKEFPGNYVMDPRSGWKTYRENTSAALIVSSGASALYADEVGIGPVKWQDPSTVSAPPIDTRSGLPWTWADWLLEMRGLLDGLTARLSVPVYCNGLGSSTRYFTAGTSTLLDHSEGALAESFIRGSSMVGEPAKVYYPNATTWTNEVRMLEDAGGEAWACTKIWADFDVATKARYLRWALGTFLLGASPGAAWYSTSARATTVTPWRSEWSQAKALGAPLGPRTALTRLFEHGSVTVNNFTHDATITMNV